MSNVQSVARTFAILEAVASDPDGVGTTQVAQQVNLPKSTVARLLLTLEGEGAVERVPNTKRFRIGPRTIALASGIPFSEYLRFFIRPYLLELTEATGEASALCLLDGKQLVVADLVQSQHLVQVQNSIGERFPLHTTSSGRVLLAHWPQTRLEQYLSQPLLYLATESNTDINVLRQQLVDIREKGYVWASEEFENITGISAPIWCQTDMTIAAINLYAPSFRFPPEGRQEDITDLVVETAHKISECIQGDL